MRTVFRTNNIDCSSRWSTPFDALGPLVAGFYTRTPLQEVIGSDCVLVVGGNVTRKTPSPNTCCGMPRGGGRCGCMLSARPSRLDADAGTVVRVQPGARRRALPRSWPGWRRPVGRCRATFSWISVRRAAGRPRYRPGGAGAGPPRCWKAAASPCSSDLLRSLERARRCSSSTTCCILRGSARARRCSSSSTAPTRWAPGTWGFCRRAAGLRPVADEAARKSLERAWGAEIPSEPGADFDAMLELCHGGVWVRSISPEATP